MTTTATRATRAPRLADWALSHGRSAFSTSDLAGILGRPAGSGQRTTVSAAGAARMVHAGSRVVGPCPS